MIWVIEETRLTVLRWSLKHRQTSVSLSQGLLHLQKCLLHFHKSRRRRCRFPHGSPQSLVSHKPQPARDIRKGQGLHLTLYLQCLVNNSQFFSFIHRKSKTVGWINNQCKFVFWKWKTHGNPVKLLKIYHALCSQRNVKTHHIFPYYLAVLMILSGRQLFRRKLFDCHVSFPSLQIPKRFSLVWRATNPKRLCLGTEEWDSTTCTFGQWV